MKKIAITGNIASGKSQVENYLKDKYPVIDTDNISHYLLDKLQDKIIEVFNDYDITENNKISRKKLGSIVFKNEILRHKLESIIHPEIDVEINKFFQDNIFSNFVFVSIPLLFETHLENQFDKIICVCANDELRLERLIKRNNLTKEEALYRINSQMPQKDKIKKSDFVIYNETNISTLHSQIDKILLSL